MRLQWLVGAKLSFHVGESSFCYNCLIISLVKVQVMIGDRGSIHYFSTGSNAWAIMRQWLHYMAKWVNWVGRKMIVNFFLESMGHAVGVSDYPFHFGLKHSFALPQTGPTLCVAWCPICWFAFAYKKYGHTWHRMSLLRPGVIKQHKPTNQPQTGHSFALPQTVTMNSHCIT